MALFSADREWNEKPKDFRTKEQRTRDNIRKESKDWYYIIVNLCEKFNIPFTTEETKDDTIIHWDGHTAILRYWHDPWKENI